MFLLSIRNSGGQGWILSSMSECYTSSRSQRSMFQSGSSWQSFTLLATEVNEVLKVINERYRLYVRFRLRMLIRNSMVSRIARRVDFLIIYFEIQNSEFEFTFFHAQRNLSYQVLLLLVRSGMSLFMAVEETGSLMGVDIQSAADDVLEKWMEVVCSVAEMRPLLRLSAYRSGLFYEGKQWRCSIPQACLFFLSREMTFS